MVGFSNLLEKLESREFVPSSLLLHGNDFGVGPPSNEGYLSSIIYQKKTVSHHQTCPLENDTNADSINAVKMLENYSITCGRGIRSCQTKTTHLSQILRIKLFLLFKKESIHELQGSDLLNLTLSSADPVLSPAV
ncbi:hypothetical protein P7K49_031469 [Saguinus oedipus]|uniref:Uncharacterized protein n=1 Tax=Saguinus oedipus TaxID=9490 RepID=A0ABQ9TZH2_SAGOE|nr:hypothetical protein P7K49_031469 [Saguinus oedipus]